MSTQNFHQSMFSTFPNGYNRSTMTKGQVLQDPGVFLVPIPPQEEVSGELQLYETGGTLSEMFGFGLTGPSNGILNHQISSEVGVLGEEKYLTKQNDSGFEFNFDTNLVNSMQISTTVNSHVGNLESHHGLSLSLSSSLQRFEDVKFEGLRVGNGGLLFSNNLGVGASLNPHIGQVHVGFGINTSLEMVNFPRNSKYLKPAQELLEEFCCVGRDQYFNNQRPKKHCLNPNSNIDGTCVTGSSSSLKEYPPLSAADKTEYQRRKINLLSMLDEVERRYRDYREKMQTMVNSFDSVMGVGAAMTYTALAQKAMSRHFRCIKSAIEAQLKLTCERLGDQQQATSSGLTKGETPRLRLVDKSLRQQKALHHMGMMMPELETWRPQRGLPEPSVNTLRAWLFEHFLHPYPSDADKHLLSRQTGLSKNQVSNWFINARVRLWKPMIEEMYQKEATDKEEQQSAAKEDAKSTEPNSEHHTTNTLSPQTPMHKVSINGTEKNQPPNTFNYRHYSLGNQVMPQVTTTATSSSMDTCRHESVVEFGDISADLASSLAKLGAPAGDVSLTLGLRHAGNLPEKRKLMVRNFETC